MSYLSVKQTADRYPAFTEKAIWEYVADRENNGFDVCTTKVGGKRIIFEDEFNIWVRTIGKDKNKAKLKQANNKKSTWEQEMDEIMSSSDFVPSPYKIIDESMVLDWHCEDGHVFPYTYREINAKGISCPECQTR